MSLIQARLKITTSGDCCRFSVEYKIGEDRVPRQCLKIERIADVRFKDDTTQFILRDLQQKMEDIVVQVIEEEDADLFNSLDPPSLNRY